MSSQFSRSWSESRQIAEEKERQSHKPVSANASAKSQEKKTHVSAAVHGTAAIQSTVHYHLFKMIASNREVDSRHVNKLINAIQKKNLLHLNPIVVNGNMEVIDGQHRLTAAKQLGIPIYYTQDSSISHDDIAGMNSNKKNWGMMDYINYYALKGNTDFIEFNKFCNKHREYTPSLLQTLCSKNGDRRTSDIKEGYIDISQIKHAEVVIGYLEDFKKYTPLAKAARFIEAIREISSHPEYNHERMMGKVQQNPTAIMPCANNRQYIQLLQQMYNKHVREDNIVIFLKR